MKFPDKPALLRMIAFRTAFIAAAVLVPGIISVILYFPRVQENIILSILFLSAVVIAAAGIVFIFIRFYITERISETGRVIRGAGTGDYVSKVDVKVNDEIGELGNEINNMIDGLRERFMFSRYVSKSAVEHMKGKTGILPEGEKRTLTVLFTDIRNFTEYSENRNPETVIEMLNTVMSLQARRIHRNGGEIEKYAGDEIMAVFDGEDMVYRAAKSAVEIRDELNKINETSITPLYIGFGINTGEMITGNMGSADSADRTVIGEAVKTGERLCSAAGRNTIVLSENSYSYISERAVFREHEPIKVRGKEKEIKIYTLVSIM